MRSPHPYEQEHLARSGRFVTVEHERMFIFERRNGSDTATVIDRTRQSLKTLFHSQSVHLTLPLWPNGTQK